MEELIVFRKTYEYLLYLRLAFEYRALSERQFTHASGRLDEILRLLRAWAKS